MSLILNQLENDDLRIEWFKRILEQLWSAETSNDPENWTKDNPAYGQCAVTAALVYTFFSGEIVRCIATLPDGTEVSHYLNWIDGLGYQDLTVSQFPEGTSFSGHDERSLAYTLTTRMADGSYAASPTTLLRFAKLAEFVARQLVP